MLSDPPYNISTSDNTINILQITDLHLSTHEPIKHSEYQLYDTLSACQRSFEAVLQQALEEDIRCDLIVVTGDLVSKVERAIYDHIFAVLNSTGIPFACIAGNHDVTDEEPSNLPFFQRELLPRSADSRLLSRYVIHTDYWQILLLNSAISGKVYGEIISADIEWLDEQLQLCGKPTLLALHHHILPMESAWIDAHMAQNTEAFWQRMQPYDHLRVVISGHTHQEQTRYRNEVTVYSTPSTCYQFKPYQDDFEYDTNALPGYRWLQLANNGQVASWIKRLDT